MADTILDGLKAHSLAVAILNFGPVWRHKKRGSVYTVVGLLAGVVYYVAHADGARWHRPLEEFTDGRFEPVTGGTPLTPAEAGFDRG